MFRLINACRRAIDEVVANYIAKFRYVADIAGIDYNPDRGLDKNQINRTDL
jgi:hypothetical protein